MDNKLCNSNRARLRPESVATRPQPCDRLPPLGVRYSRRRGSSRAAQRATCLPDLLRDRRRDPNPPRKFPAPVGRAAAGSLKQRLRLFNNACTAPSALSLAPRKITSNPRPKRNRMGFVFGLEPGYAGRRGKGRRGDKSLEKHFFCSFYLA